MVFRYQTVAVTGWLIAAQLGGAVLVSYAAWHLGRWLLRKGRGP